MLDACSSHLVCEHLLLGISLVVVVTYWKKVGKKTIKIKKDIQFLEIQRPYAPEVRDLKADPKVE